MFHAGAGMTKKLVKKLTVKRLIRKIKKSLTPQSLSLWQVQWRWRRRDPREWPSARLSGGEDINRYEYSLFSQHGEDGIIRYLLSEVGIASRTFVEFGFGVVQNNSLRLVLNEDFQGLFIDGSEESCSLFNRSAERLRLENVFAISRFLNVDNIQEIIRRGVLSGEIDFLSIDVDGNDYWFWGKIDCISPRIVCIEYNAGFGPDWSVTVAYDPDFRRFHKHPSGFYHGCSISALDKLGVKKGYRLVGCDSSGTNAFFLRADITAPDVPTLIPSVAYRPHQNWLERGFSQEEQLKILKSIPEKYVEV